MPALLAIGIVSVAAVWILNTSSGLRTAIAIADLLTAVSIEAQGIEGSLVHGFSAQRLNIRAASWSVGIEGLAVEPGAMSWGDRSVNFERLAARQAAVEWVSDSREPARIPDSLALPFSLHVRALGIDELSIGARGGTALHFKQVALSGKADQSVIQIEETKFVHGDLQSTLAGRVSAAPPFGLQAEGRVNSVLLGHGVEARIEAKGELARVDLDLALRAGDAGTTAERGTLHARLTPFAPVPIAYLDAELHDWEATRWLDSVPSMRLSGRTHLAQIAVEPGFTLAGTFEATNASPGPIDSGRIPVNSARGSVRWTEGRLTLDVEDLRGARGQATGRIELSGTALDRIDVRAKVEGIDAAAIHSRLTPTAVRGDLQFEQQPGAGRLRAQLSNARGLPLVVDADVVLLADVIDIAPSTIRLGAGKARAQGKVGLTGTRLVRLTAVFEQFDLAALVPGIATRLGGELDIDGALQPAPRGRAKFSLRDSQVQGRPANGQGTFTLEGQTLVADLELASRSARLLVKGGLGSSQELQANLDVPALGELLDGAEGAVTARITAQGSVAEPQFKLTAGLSALKLRDGLSLRSATIEAAGGLGNSDPLALVIRLADLETAAGPDGSLSEATLIGRGTTGSHTLEFNANTASRQPVRVIVSGGWKPASGGVTSGKSPGQVSESAWRGSIVAAETGAPLELRLRDAPLMVSLSALALGPASFELRGASFSEVEYRRTGRSLVLQGAFAGLRPQSLNVESRALQRVTRSRAATRVPLTLGGRWEIQADGDSITGVVAVERTAGDLYAGIDALRPVGISDVGLALSIVANRANGSAYLRGRDFGAVDSSIDAVLERVGDFGIRVAPSRPLRLSLDARLGDLGWIGPLVSDNVEFGGAAKATVQIEGTIEDPLAHGELSGSQLRLAWVEQGLRLENGTLDAVLEDGVLVLKDLTLFGTTRVEPEDPRASADLDTAHAGQVRAFGRMALGSLTGSFAAHAERLPVLQRRDRWMVVSGDGGVTLTPRRAEVTAKLTADGAYLDLSGLSRAAAVSSDVVVKRRSDPVRAQTAPPVDIVLDLRGDLGRRFYMKGGGVDTRLAGSVDLKRVNGQFVAVGAVQAVGGVFNRYGQRLQIERGIVTFQGPPENPALNVLALRTGLPVEVGVAVTGTLARPVVRLHSDPSMPDAEKLNWLVLGRPPASGAGDAQDRAVLAAAANALLAGQTDSANSQLLRSLGIDEIGLRTGTDVGSLLPRETVAGRLRASSGSALPSDVISVGKRINEQLFLSFEQALTGAAYSVALSYRVTQRLSVVGRAGTQNALDLVYSFAFD
jgi:translocation and assembly module TamB